MKRVKFKGGTFYLKIARVRWYHKILFKHKLYHLQELAKLTIQLNLDNKGNLFCDDYIHIDSGDYFV